jgi:hypothetical protein
VPEACPAAASNRGGLTSVQRVNFS